jgi:hypothetical protein
MPTITARAEFNHKYSTATTSLPLLSMLAQATIGGSNILVRPNINHRPVYLHNIVSGGSSKRDMKSTVYSNEPTITFDGSPIGIMFYSVKTTEPAKSVEQALQSPTSDGVPLMSYANHHMQEPPGQGQLLLTNVRATQPTEQDWEIFCGYFSLDDVADEGDGPKPSCSHLAGALENIGNDYNPKTKQDILAFVSRRGINIDFQDEDIVEVMRFKLLVHYQSICPIRVAPYEGGHRITTAYSFLHGFYPTPLIPAEPAWTNNTSDHQAVPSHSPLFAAVNVEVSQAVGNTITNDFLEGVKSRGKVMTLSQKNSIDPNWRSVLSSCVDVFQQSYMNGEFTTIDNAEADYIATPYQPGENDPYFKVREIARPKYMAVAAEDAYIGPQLELWFQDVGNKAGIKDVDALTKHMMNTFNTYKLVYLKENFKGTPPSQYYRNFFPHILHYLFHLVDYSLQTGMAVTTMRQFVGEPEWKEQLDIGGSEIHSDGFIRMMCHQSVAITEQIIKGLAKHNMWKAKFKSPTKTKTSHLVRYNVLQDMFRCLNYFGPNPKMKTSSPFHKIVE